MAPFFIIICALRAMLGKEEQSLILRDLDHQLHCHVRVTLRNFYELGLFDPW